jgi:hypothetical protein
MNLNVLEARDFLRSWESALLKFRHGAEELHCNIIAVHLLLNLALTLLPCVSEPTWSDNTFSTDPNMFEVDFSDSNYNSNSMSVDVGEEITTGYLPLTLLPVTDDDRWQETTKNEAMDYVLQRAAELLSVEDLTPDYRKDLEETITLVLEKVIKYGGGERFVQRALILMRGIAMQ